MNTKREFRRWLKAMPAHTVVGIAGDAHNNPLANWVDSLYANNETDLFAVAVAHSVILDGAFVRDLADWEEHIMAQQDFMRRFAPIERETVLAWLAEEEARIDNLRGTGNGPSQGAAKQRRNGLVQAPARGRVSAA